MDTSMKIEYCFVFFFGDTIVRFLYHKRQATSLTLIAVFAFSFSSLNLQTSSDPSISAQNSRDRASNMQICHASAFQFFQAATINDIITTHLQFQFIYFHPICSCFSLKKVTENRKTKMMSQSGN